MIRIEIIKNENEDSYKTMLDVKGGQYEVIQEFAVMFDLLNRFDARNGNVSKIGRAFSAIQREQGGNQNDK